MNIPIVCCVFNVWLSFIQTTRKYVFILTICSLQTCWCTSLLVYLSVIDVVLRFKIKLCTAFSPSLSDKDNDESTSYIDFQNMRSNAKLEKCNYSYIFVKIEYILKYCKWHIINHGWYIIHIVVPRLSRKRGTLKLIRSSVWLSVCLSEWPWSYLLKYWW